MKVTYSWLQDFVDIKIPAMALADKLTMAGLEVTAIEEKEADFVFEIEVTPNRPDALSVFGIAREIAAITGRKLKPSSAKDAQRITRNAQPIAIKIEDKKDCPLYTAKIIRGVKVGPSPAWLKKRLELVGCRSVNNVVDITNYILFTFGEPLHAFDLDKLSGNSLIVRRAKENEKITTIDGMQRQLSTQILLIADGQKAIAVAGVMGAQNSEVTASTKNILLEAAIFSPAVIRRSRLSLGLQSESSYRFERGVDLETAQSASWQAVKLIQQVCGGELTLAKSAGAAQQRKKEIVLDIDNTNKILGVNIPAAKIKNVLTRLEFGVKPKAKKILVTVPGHRQDINLEIDLVEEVARIYGYDNIPATLPKVSPVITDYKAKCLVPVIKNILVGLGLTEVITYSLMERALAKSLCVECEPLGILNPISREQEVLRPTVVAGLLKVIAVNLNQKQNYINIFEVAKSFSGSVGAPQENAALGVALCGEAGALRLKGIIETLFFRLGIKNYSFAADTGGFGIYLGKDLAGRMRNVQAHILAAFEIKNKEAAVLEINLEKLFGSVRLDKKFQVLPLYPAIVRDISFILGEKVRVEEVLAAVREGGGALLEEAKIIDYYKGRQIPQGFRALTLSCVYRSGERTLTEAEVAPVHALVCARLKDRFSAQIR
ncbi:MAG: phenylalanine--tRNA ligase subunit beta [Candidatus Omnitrophota bacterium]